MALWRGIVGGVRGALTLALFAFFGAGAPGPTRSSSVKAASAA